MIKIITLSDSHGEFTRIYDILEREKPEIVIFTGDGTSEMRELSLVFSNIKFYIVKGNCDIFELRYDEMKQFKLKRIEIFITHGHLFDVKRDMRALEREAENRGVNLVCFGHTHIPYFIEKRGIRYLNPGAFRDGRYAIIYIDNDKINIENKEIGR